MSMRHKTCRDEKRRRENIRTHNIRLAEQTIWADRMIAQNRRARLEKLLLDRLQARRETDE